MIRKLIGVLLLIGSSTIVSAQELYVFTEPASNMPANSIGARLTYEAQFQPMFNNRTMAEVMFGLSKDFMFHLQGSFSDFDGNYRLEGGSIYAKYRFLAIDGEKSHFRGALYGRLATSKRPTFTQDINLEGDNSGAQGGLIFTQLLHKLALSATLGYSKAKVDINKQFADTDMPDQLLNYSLSSGYLLLPVVYKNYNQPNFNLYLELLGKTNPVGGNSYLDLAPAVQMILNSKTRIDFGYRFQLSGNIENRYAKNMYLARIEFNFFNALSKKQ